MVATFLLLPWGLHKATVGNNLVIVGLKVWRGKARFRLGWLVLVHVLMLLNETAAKRLLLTIRRGTQTQVWTEFIVHTHVRVSHRHLCRSRFLRLAFHFLLQTAWKGACRYLFPLLYVFVILTDFLKLWDFVIPDARMMLIPVIAIGCLRSFGVYVPELVLYVVSKGFLGDLNTDHFIVFMD